MVVFTCFSLDRSQRLVGIHDLSFGNVMCPPILPPSDVFRIAPLLYFY
jgi:hypothetical protein